ncbi:MAG TPA: AMP-binding protein [Mycobacteriales bacterium]|jgi:long-chain acyl-CoA synthetase|nr:AMP-binding protein [Mycobacteriales bacterium]
MPTLAALSGVDDPSRIAVDDGERQLSWQALDEATTQFGHGIEALGATPGSHVAICVSNRVEFVVALIGAWRAGCAYTPLKTGWTAAEVGAVLDDAHTAVVVTDRDGARAAAAERATPVVDLDDAGFGSWLATQSAEPFGEDRCGYKMPYTSGTTGRPKGVVMRGSGTTPFATGWAGIARWAEVLELPGDGVHLFCSRLFNGAPQTFGFGALARGATLRVMRRWDATVGLDELSRPDVTSTIMVPTMFRQILALPADVRAAAPPPSLRTVLHGGEPCPIPVKHAISGVLGDVLVEYYGFTEGGMAVVRRDEWRDRPGTVGRPLPGMAVRVLDDAGDPVPIGSEGTVYFAPAKGRMFRYQGDDAKTEGAHVGDAFTVGDIGRLDADGFLYLCGRAAEIVVSAGVNVYPAEVDQALCDVAGIADLAAVGAPDDERGEVIALFVTLLPGVDETTVNAAIEATAAERLAPYKQPRSVTVVEEIPRDQTGKLLRRVLRDQLWEGKNQFA